jgi:transposase-like protein
VTWATLYWPHRDCRCDGQPCTAGLWVKQGRRRGAPQARCHACGGRVPLRYGTASYGLETDRALFEMALRAFAAGKALRATARLVQVDKATVGAWLDRVARHCRVVLLSLWHNLHVAAGQRDEWWSCGHTKAAQLPGATRSGATYGDAWVWLAFAPVWRLVLAFVLGKRAQARAAVLRARVAQTTDDHLPFFPSAQWPAYQHAVRPTDGAWYQPARRGPRGASPKPQRRPLPGLWDARVVPPRATGRGGQSARTWGLASQRPWRRAWRPPQ